MVTQPTQPMTTSILTGESMFPSISLSGELWLQAKGENSNYFVSNMGRLLTTSYRGGYRTEVMKPAKNHNGYLMTVVSGKAKTIHRIIAKTFIPNPEGKETVNHKNGIKADNRVENLEWMTRKEQSIHLWNIGLRTDQAILGNNLRKISEKEARELLQFRLTHSTMPIRMMADILKDRTGLNYDGIRDLLSGRTWKHLQEEYPHKKQTVWEARREKVYESTDVWSITVENNHNYFANGVNVSNSLKSHTVARILLIRARQKKTRVACFREFQNSIADSSYQLLVDLIQKYDLKDFSLTKNSIINTINGSDFIFKGLWNNEQSIKSVEGIDIAWIEEAQTVSEKSLEVLTPTVRKKGSQLIYTYNRLLEEDPVHKRLVTEGRPNTLIINVNYDIALKYNMMPDAVRLEMEDDKASRPNLYKHKWLGDPYSLERKVFKDWAIIDEIPHEARLYRYGMDFGFSQDPTSITAIYEYNGGYIFDEIVYQKGLSNKSIADIFLNNEKALVIADSAEPKSIDEIKNYGINILGAKKGQGSVYQGIQYVHDQKCSVTKRSTNIIKAYRNYLFRQDKDGKILNEPDDSIHEWSNSMDSIRYGLNGESFFDYSNYKVKTY